MDKKTIDFIKKAKEVHGEKYDYSKVNYVCQTNKICIICPVHGEFWQTPYVHLKGHGCSECSHDNHRMTTEKFIKRAKEIHGDKYNYSKVEYVDAKTPVCIICPKHGEFYILPDLHLRKKQECKICSGNKMTTETFIEKAKKVHGDKYDYSKVNYINSHTKVCIICPEHGEFWQTPNGHLNGAGCPSCSGNKKMTKYDFIYKSNILHCNKYDYSKVKYKNNNTNVCIICPEHGEFWQTPHSHLSGAKCPKCTHQSYKDTKESFTEKAQKIHGDRYDYSKVEYVNSHTKVCITCPIHGNFWMIPTNHISGKGCPICKESKYERLIRELLKKEKIDFIIKKKFKWLGQQHLDFYLPKQNIAIECQGGQHLYEDKTSMFYGTLETIIKRDKRKNMLCENNGMKLLYYIDGDVLKKASSLPEFYDNNYYSTKEEILEQIKNA